MLPGPQITAWRPSVAGITEVFHAHYVDHAYPGHTHDVWTLLIVDSGAIGYRIDRHEHDSTRDHVTLLPPEVPHDGRTVTADGFRKRVLYLDADTLTGIGPAVDLPTIRDPLLRRRIHHLHAAVRGPDTEFEAQIRLAIVLERLQAHLRGHEVTPAAPGRPLAHALRELIDARIDSGISLDEASATLHAAGPHLVRSFSREFGIAPHRYLLGRRIERARRLLLSGMPPAEVAGAVGFHDQSHLNRHFKRMLGTTPGRFAVSCRGGGAGR